MKLQFYLYVEKSFCNEVSSASIGVSNPRKNHSAKIALEGISTVTLFTLPSREKMSALNSAGISAPNVAESTVTFIAEIEPSNLYTNGILKRVKESVPSAPNSFFKSKAGLKRRQPFSISIFIARYSQELINKILNSTYKIRGFENL